MAARKEGKGRKGPLARLRARRGSEQPRSYRIANSIRLPWTVGVVAYLLVALFAGLAIGRSSETATDVPPVVLDYQEGLTVQIAQSIRRSVNEGVNDVEVFAGALSVAIGSGATVQDDQVGRLLDGFSGIHGRYRSLAIVDSGGRVLRQVGADIHDEATPDDLPAGEPGIADVVQSDDDALIIGLRAPVPETDLTAIAEYDPGFLRFSLENASPGDAWVLNKNGRVIADQGGGSDLSELPRRVLREAVVKATGGASGVEMVGGSVEDLEVVGFSPVSGAGPTGTLGWSVVSTRTVASLPTPGTSTRRVAVLFALQLAILTITMFGWLWIVIIRPIIDIQLEAERIAFGDLTTPVKVERYDEIGLLGRALERTRVLLIRRRGGVGARSKSDAPVRARASDSGLAPRGGPENRKGTAADRGTGGERRASDGGGDEGRSGSADDRAGSASDRGSAPDAPSGDGSSGDGPAPPTGG